MTPVKKTAVTLGDNHFTGGISKFSVMDKTMVCLHSTWRTKLCYSHPVQPKFRFDQSAT